MPLFLLSEITIVTARGLLLPDFVPYSLLFETFVFQAGELGKLLCQHAADQVPGGEDVKSPQEWRTRLRGHHHLRRMERSTDDVRAPQFGTVASVDHFQLWCAAGVATTCPDSTQELLDMVALPNIPAATPPRTFLRELSYTLACPHGTRARQSFPSVINCNVHVTKINRDQQPMTGFVDDVMMRELAPFMASCSKCGLSADWTSTGFASRESAPAVMAFLFPEEDVSGRTGVTELIDLSTVDGFSINGTEYELHGVVYSLPSHFVAEIKRGGVFYGYDDLNGSRLLPQHKGCSRPSFAIATKNHGTQLVHDFIVALFYGKKI